MSYFTVVGSKCYLSTGLDAAKTVNDISNANPAVVTTSAAHGLATNDEGVLFTGWDDFNESVFRIGAASGSTFTLPGYDSTDTTFYPQGSDPGTFQKVAGWTEIGQVLGITGEGGTARGETINPYDKRNGIFIPTGFEASRIQLELGYDPLRADQQALAAASRVLGKRALRFVLAGPSYVYLYGIVSMSPLPVFGNVLRRNVSVASSGGIATFFV